MSTFFCRPYCIQISLDTLSILRETYLYRSIGIFDLSLCSITLIAASKPDAQLVVHTGLWLCCHWVRWAVWSVYFSNFDSLWQSIIHPWTWCDTVHPWMYSIGIHFDLCVHHICCEGNMLCVLIVITYNINSIFLKISISSLLTVNVSLHWLLHLLVLLLVAWDNNAGRK